MDEASLMSVKLGLESILNELTSKGLHLPDNRKKLSRPEREAMHLQIKETQASMREYIKLFKTILSQIDDLRKTKLHLLTPTKIILRTTQQIWITTTHPHLPDILVCLYIHKHHNRIQADLVHVSNLLKGLRSRSTYYVSCDKARPANLKENSACFDQFFSACDHLNLIPRLKISRHKWSYLLSPKFHTQCAYIKGRDSHNGIFAVTLFTHHPTRRPSV